MSDLNNSDFDDLEDKVDRLAEQQAQPHAGPHHRFNPAHSEEDFEQLVSTSLDELPGEVIARLKNVAIVVSDGGGAQNAYGMYNGANVLSKGAFTSFWGGGTNQITIFRDTLVRDFGHDPKLLVAKVRETVRHEVGHFLGMNEDEVRELGL